MRGWNGVAHSPYVQVSSTDTLGNAPQRVKRLVHYYYLQAVKLGRIFAVDMVLQPGKLGR